MHAGRLVGCGAGAVPKRILARARGHHQHDDRAWHTMEARMRMDAARGLLAC